MIGTLCSVRYFLNHRNKKSENKVPIFLRVSIHRKKSEVFLNQFADPQFWDDSKQRLIVKSKSDSFVNHGLNELENKINEIVWDLEHDNEVVSAKAVVQRLTGKSKKSRNSVLTFIDQFIDEAKAKGELSKEVIMQYSTMKTHLTKYFKTKGREDMLLSQMKRSDLDGFEHFLLTDIHPVLNRAMNRNTSNKYLVRLKTVFNNAIRKQILTTSPFVGLKIKSVKVEKAFLTKEELERLKSHDLAGNESLIRVRDFFLFSVYTGLRFSDAIALKVDNIKKEKGGRLWLMGHQKKTKDPIEIPMFEQAKLIYDKYETHRLATGFILPRLQNQKVNTYLKEIARLVGINKHVHHHVARHTFATTVLLENGVDIKTVSRFMGHYSVKSTEVYAKITKDLLENVAGRIEKI